MNTPGQDRSTFRGDGTDSKGGVKDSFGWFFERMFAPRQLIFRSNDSVKAFSLPSWLQITSVTMIFVAVMWTAYASMTTFYSQPKIKSQQGLIVHQNSEIDRLLAHISGGNELLGTALSQMNLNVSFYQQLEEALENKETFLAKIKSENVRSNRESTKAVLALLKDMKDDHGAAPKVSKQAPSLRTASSSLTPRENEEPIEEVSIEAPSANSEFRFSEKDATIGALQKELSRLRLENDTFKSQKVAAVAQLNSSQARLSVAEAALADTKAMLYDGSAGESEELSKLEEMVYVLQLRIDDLVEEKADVETANIKLARQVETLESSATVGYEVHKSIITGLRRETADKVESYEEALNAAGLSISGLRSQAEKTKPDDIDLAPPGASGGPFIPNDESFEFEEPVLNEESHFDIDELWSYRRDILMNLHKMSVMEPRVLATPLANPTSGLRLTSRFGTRKDPINKKRSMHYGIDFAGPIGAKIRAPAAGRVIYAGRKGSFGKFIEINHGWGIITRYAHLNKIYVSVGDRVKLNQKIGTLGNTGRSTGPHLHYEIRVNGTRRNPLKFIRAAKYVQ